MIRKIHRCPDCGKILPICLPPYARRDDLVCKCKRGNHPRSAIIESKKAITPFAKIIEKKGIPVEETIFVGSIDDFNAFLDKELKKVKDKYIILSLPPQRIPKLQEVDLSFFTTENDFTHENIRTIKELKKGEICDASNGTHFISRIVFIKGDKKAEKYVEEHGWSWIK